MEEKNVDDSSGCMCVYTPEYHRKDLCEYLASAGLAGCVRDNSGCLFAGTGVRRDGRSVGESDVRCDFFGYLYLCDLFGEYRYYGRNPGEKKDVRYAL